MLFAAIEFAARAHAGQFRKGTRLPYIVHPIGAMKLVIEHGGGDAAAIAAVLHDTVEDTPVSHDDVRRAFGDAVAELVAWQTETDKALPWETRKQHTLAQLGVMPPDALLVACADKLDNLRALRADHDRTGDALWARFNRGRDSQAWYYRQLAAAFGARTSADLPLLATFIAEVERMFGSAAAASEP